MSELTYDLIVVSDDKPLVWLGAEINSPPFSVTAKREAGFLIRQLQRGDLLSMPQSRPMPTIGPRCHELRITDVNTTWRIIYRIDHDAIVLLSVFAKETQATPKNIIDMCKGRLAEYDSI